MSSNIESIRGERRSLPKEREGKVRSWGEMKIYLPGLPEGSMNILQDYFRAQHHIARGKKIKAKGILAGLDKKNGFREFEDENDSLFELIDKAATGSSNRAKSIRWPS